MTLDIFIILLVGSFTLSASGSLLYISLAIKMKILSLPSSRGLHSIPTPSGGGFVFSIIFMIGLFFLFYYEYLEINALIALAGGGLALSTLGLVDDFSNVSPKFRIALHIAAASLALLCFSGLPPINVFLRMVDLGWAGHILALIGLVWLINLYNFMDGIDGIASSNAMFFALTTAFILFFIADSNTAIIPLLLATCVAGFTLFNWPPARLFMGDSGSAFLGYTFGVLIMMTLEDRSMSIWTWIIIMGYFLSDSTTTLLWRILIMKESYKIAHRSHAYQNFAKIFNSHGKVTGSILLINVLWLFPLSIWSATSPDIAPLITIIAIFPLIVITIKFGPRFSNS